MGIVICDRSCAGLRKPWELSDLRLERLPILVTAFLFPSVLGEVRDILCIWDAQA